MRPAAPMRSPTAFGEEATLYRPALATAFGRSVSPHSAVFPRKRNFQPLSVWNHQNEARSCDTGARDDPHVLPWREECGEATNLWNQVARRDWTALEVEKSSRVKSRSEIARVYPSPMDRFPCAGHGRTVTPASRCRSSRRSCAPRHATPAHGDKVRERHRWLGVQASTTASFSNTISTTSVRSVTSWLSTIGWGPAPLRTSAGACLLWATSSPASRTC